MLDDVILLQENSPEDYVLRGFSQDDILSFIQYDVGYHGNGVKAKIKGIDRNKYKMKYIIEHNDSDKILSVLDKYAQGLTKELVLRELGIAGANIVKLRVLFSSIGYADEFVEADKAQRLFNMRKGTESKYGVDNVFKLSEFQEKAASTREDKYGARYTLADGSVLADSARETMNAHMNGDDFKESVINQRKNTTFLNYGVSSPSKSSVIQQRMQETCKDRYGVDHYMKTDEAKEKQREYMLLHGKAIFKKSRVTCMERYGVPNYAMTDEARINMSNRMSDVSVRQSLLNTRKQNQTDIISSSELDFGKMLISIFGEDDVESQYFDENRYPFVCDFYIKSRDLFIELNAHWSHGGHWYDDNNVIDCELNQKWLNGSDYYKKCSETWSIRDVKKRDCASRNNLNYVTLWDTNLQDAVLWIGMDCPDGTDWKCEYSWLPDRKLEPMFCFPELVGSERNVIQIAKAANFSEFYHRELVLWSENPMDSHWGTLQARLYSNRYKYIGKSPNELSNFDILRGLNVSGLVRGYSVFHNSGMVYLLEKYDVKSLYDPCMGWGERLSTCAAQHVKYVGCDINKITVDGNQRIIDNYNVTDCCVVCSDSSKFDMSNGLHDCVFTCPPYENVEIYTDDGAENLNHDDFLVWWSDVVAHSISDSTKVFAYQINTRFKDAMNDILLNAGWILIEQLAVGSTSISHMNRCQGRVKRKYYDEIQIFVRKE